MNTFIFGASGFAKEVEWLISECAKDRITEITAFVTHSSDPLINSYINNIPIISEEEYFQKWNRLAFHQVYVAVGSPTLKARIVKKIENSFTEFPNLIHPNVVMDHRKNANNMGKGIIICAGVSLTTNVSIHDFVHLNLSTTVGHDCVIGSFSTISPGVSISGNVVIGQEVFIGTRACTTENLRINDKIVIGAGAVVTKTLTEQGTYVGIPAKRIT